MITVRSLFLRSVGGCNLTIPHIHGKLRTNPGSQPVIHDPLSAGEDVQDGLSIDCRHSLANKVVRTEGEQASALTGARMESSPFL